MKTLDVKVLDMENGRVKRIEYNGEFYRIIPDDYPSVKGDICLNKNEEFGDWKSGMYFKNVAEDSSEYYLPQGGDKGVYMDDEANLYRENCDVFRKREDFKVGDVVYKPLYCKFYEIGELIDEDTIKATTGELLSVSYSRIATYNEHVKFKEKDNKPEYLEVHPVEAYKLYFQGKQNVYCCNSENLYYRHATLSDFNPSVIKANGFKFYIKEGELNNVKIF